MSVVDPVLFVVAACVLLIRSMATIIGMIFAFTILDCDIPLDRSRTHPLENFSGLLRKLLYDCNKFNEFLHTTARNAIVTARFDEVRHLRDIYGRENLGGAFSQTEGRAFKDPQCTPEEAEKHIWATLAVSNAEDAQFALEEGVIRDMTKVLVWLEELAEMSSAKRMEDAGHFVIRPTANLKIMASLLQ
jgi:hypothetical protein